MHGLNNQIGFNSIDNRFNRPMFFNTFTQFPASGAVGGWVDLGRTTLGSSADTITVSSLADKRYYMVLWDATPTGAVYHEARLGNSSVDTGSNYAYRISTNGAEGTGTSQSVLSNGVAGGSTPAFHVGYWANLSGKEKLGITQSIGQSTAGAGTAPIRREIVAKWVNTSNPIDIFQMYNSNSGSYDTGSEVVVLGWDPADTHTNNFWEELASVNGDGTSGFSTGTITAKKYLWIQAYVVPSASSLAQFVFNSDTTSYSGRRSSNGGTDSTETSQAQARASGTDAFPKFLNYFVINNSANEKLGMGVGMGQSNTGAANPPIRQENVWKWDNTSSQITDIEVKTNTGNFSSTSIMKVWGAD